MYSYRKGQDITPECNSVGCIIGHCTALDPNPLPRWGEGGIRFCDWAVKFTELVGDEWKWCFSSKWLTTDNTPEGAALRIEWLLNNGLPENWVEQMNGTAPLCYA